ncbi:MAG: hypothetical protein ACFFCQ_05155 [Promethearchaeota archaeon]
MSLELIRNKIGEGKSKLESLQTDVNANDFSEPIDLFQEALSECEKLNPPNYPVQAEILTFLADSLGFEGERRMDPDKLKSAIWQGERLFRIYDNKLTSLEYYPKRTEIRQKIVKWKDLRLSLL